MKKSFKYLSLLIAIIFIITGCSSKDPKTQLEDASKKTADANSFSYEMNLNAEITAESQSTSIGLKSSGDYYLKDKKPTAHMNTNISLLGMSQEAEQYVTVKDNTLYTYTKSDDEWTYTKSEFKEDSFDTSKITDYVKDAKEVKSVKSDKKGYTKLEVVVSADKLNEALNSTGADELLSEENISAKVNKDLTLNVYLKGGYISIIEVDLSDVLKDALSSLLSSGDAKVTFSIELKDHNKVKEVKVPSDVENSAKLNEE